MSAEDEPNFIGEHKTELILVSGMVGGLVTAMAFKRLRDKFRPEEEPGWVDEQPSDNS